MAKRKGHILVLEGTRRRASGHTYSVQEPRINIAKDTSKRLPTGSGEKQSDAKDGSYACSLIKKPISKHLQFRAGCHQDHESRETQEASWHQFAPPDPEEAGTSIVWVLALSIRASLGPSPTVEAASTKIPSSPAA